MGSTVWVMKCGTAIATALSGQLRTRHATILCLNIVYVHAKTRERRDVNQTMQHSTQLHTLQLIHQITDVKELRDDLTAQICGGVW